MSATSKDYRASNGIYYRIEGEGEPLLLLHGLMVAGAMFDPLVALLRDRFRMLIPTCAVTGKAATSTAHLMCQRSLGTSIPFWRRPVSISAP